MERISLGRLQTPHLESNQVLSTQDKTHLLRVPQSRLQGEFERLLHMSLVPVQVWLPPSSCAEVVSANCQVHLPLWLCTKTQGLSTTQLETHLLRNVRVACLPPPSRLVQPVHELQHFARATLMLLHVLGLVIRDHGVEVCTFFDVHQAHLDSSLAISLEVLSWECRGQL